MKDPPVQIILIPWQPVASSTRCSLAVTHPITNRAQRCLTSVIGREPVFPTWYSRYNFKYTFVNNPIVLLSSSLVKDRPSVSNEIIFWLCGGCKLYGLRFLETDTHMTPLPRIQTAIFEAPWPIVLQSFSGL